MIYSKAFTIRVLTNAPRAYIITMDGAKPLDHPHTCILPLPSPECEQLAPDS